MCAKNFQRAGMSVVRCALSTALCLLCALSVVCSILLRVCVLLCDLFYSVSYLVVYSTLSPALLVVHLVLWCTLLHGVSYHGIAGAQLGEIIPCSLKKVKRKFYEFFMNIFLHKIHTKKILDRFAL